MKQFLQFLKKESSEFSTPLIIAIFVAGLVNGIGVMVATKAVGDLKEGKLNVSSFILFCACIVAYWVSKELVLNRTTTILEEIIERLRLRILYKIRETNLLPFESIDKGRVYATLSSDAISISASAGLILNGSSSLIMLAFTFVILATISMKALLMTVGLVAIAVVYFLRHKKEVDDGLTQATLKENEFFDNLNGFLNGFKELKLNRDKRNDYFEEEIEEVIRKTKKHRIDSGKALNHAMLIGHTYLFFTLAGLIYVLPVLFPDQTKVIPMLVPVVLFMAGPLADVVGAMTALSKAEASIVNIYELEGSIDDRIKQSATAEEGPVFVPAPKVFESLSCEALTFQYSNGGRHPFKVHPADFELKAGQIIFIVGGNGSGKSTFLKLITGLYKADSGTIRLNGEEIHEGNISMLREIFSPIFTDFHLFKRVLGTHKPDDTRVTELLTRMELADKTSIVDGRVSNMNLSTGQRKRLALVLSTLDDRPIHLFDEWAADQDPVFRKFFYEVLLAQMVKEGKTILAVTHDDHYFHVADKVYAMEYGKLVDYKKPKATKKAAKPHSSSGLSPA